jgi:hypothetical protein
VKKRNRWRRGYVFGLWWAEHICEEVLGLMLHGNDPGGYGRAAVERVKEGIGDCLGRAQESRECVCGGKRAMARDRGEE